MSNILEHCQHTIKSSDIAEIITLTSLIQLELFMILGLKQYYIILFSIFVCIAIYLSYKRKRPYTDFSVIISIISSSVFIYYICVHIISIKVIETTPINSFLGVIIAFTSGNLMKDRIERLCQYFYSNPSVTVCIERNQSYFHATKMQFDIPIYYLRISILNTGTATAKSVSVALRHLWHVNKIGLVDLQTIDDSLIPENFNTTFLDIAQINIHRGDRKFFDLLQCKYIDGKTEFANSVCLCHNFNANDALRYLRIGEYIADIKVQGENFQTVCCQIKFTIEKYANVINYKSIEINGNRIDIPICDYIEANSLFSVKECDKRTETHK